MFRLIAVAVVGLALGSSAQALTPAPLHQLDGMVTQARFGCGPFRTRVAGAAWPEPPSVIPAEWPAERIAGAIKTEPGASHRS